MMVMFNVAFGVGLVALSCGVALVIWSMRHEGAGVTLAKIFGYIIIILSTLTLACTVFYSIKMCYEMKTMRRDSMMNTNMMMPGMMQNQQEDSSTSKDR